MCFLPLSSQYDNICQSCDLSLLTSPSKDAVTNRVEYFYNLPRAVLWICVRAVLWICVSKSILNLFFAFSLLVLNQPNRAHAWYARDQVEWSLKKYPYVNYEKNSGEIVNLTTSGTQSRFQNFCKTSFVVTVSQEILLREICIVKKMPLHTFHVRSFNIRG